MELEKTLVTEEPLVFILTPNIVIRMILFLVYFLIKIWGGFDQINTQLPKLLYHTHSLSIFFYDNDFHCPNSSRYPDTSFVITLLKKTNKLI